MDAEIDPLILRRLVRAQTGNQFYDLASGTFLGHDGVRHSCQ
jgi:hypothetical protein